ncbi:TetR/AcrR family transcriptional regulator [Spirochaeta dissipatitropha]
MPKVVDHDAWRQELVQRAIPVFRKHGYSGVGMRMLAQEMGVSKTSLYHYYPNKRSLFLDCSRHVANIHIREDVSPIMAIIELVSELELIFLGEIRLLVDYLGQLEISAVEDEALALVNDQYDEAFSRVVGKDKAQQVLILVYGYLLKRMIDIRSTDISELRSLLELVLK